MAKIYRLLLLFFAFAMAAFGQAASRYDGVVIDQNGKPVVGANVRVCTTPATGQPCTPLANVYTNSGMTFPAQNPLTTDFLGNFYFYIPSGIYELEFSGPGIITKQVPDVTITVPQTVTNPVFTSLTANTADIGTLNGFVYVDGTINTTIAGAISTLPSTGGTVIIPCGTYTLSSTLVIPSNVILEGCGIGSTTSGGTRLVAASGTVTPLIQIQGSTPTARSGDIFLRDMTIQGVYTASQICMQIDHATYIVQDHVQYVTCGQAEWDNDVYRSLHTDVTYFQSGSGGTNTTATVRVENISNPSVPTEQIFFIDCTWQGDPGGKQGTAVYFGPATQEERVIASKIDYFSDSPNFPLVYVNQANIVDISNNTISGYSTVAPALGVVYVTGTSGARATQVHINNNTTISFSNTVPAILFDYAVNYEVVGGTFQGPGSGTAIVTTTNTFGGSIGPIQMASTDTPVNDVSLLSAVFYHDSSSGQLDITSKLLVSGQTLFKGPIPEMDVMAYGAKCDNATDDFAALQLAGNASIASSGIMTLPPGRYCKFNTGLVFTGAIHIRGATAFGPGESNLIYGGTGNAITIQNGSSIIYNVNLENFDLGSVNAAAQTGIYCNKCYQYFVTNVYVYGEGNVITQQWGWQIGFDIENCAGMVFNNVWTSDINNGIKINNSPNFNMNEGVFYGENIDYLIGGNSQGIWIHDLDVAEAQNYFMVIDDTVTPGLIFLDGVTVENNYILFDQAGGSSNTYQPNWVLKFNNTGSNEIYAPGMTFRDNFILCPNSACSSAPATPPNYAFNLSNTSSSAGSIVNLTVQRNIIDTYASGGLTANSTKIRVNWTDNFNTLADGLTPNTDVNGTGVFVTQDFLSTGMSFGFPFTTNGITNASNGITNTGGITNTSVGITDQGVTKMKRPYFNQGTLLASGNVALSSGWGTSPSFVIGGFDPAFAITINAGTGTPTANPFAVITFADGAWADANPICVVSRYDADPPGTAPVIATTTTTAVTLTFIGTPTVSTGYTFDVLCSGR
jgi:hypothetical protein